MAKTKADFLTNLTNFNVKSLTDENSKDVESNEEIRNLYYVPATYMKDLNLSTYNSLIRFIPYYKNPENSILSKYVSWITNNKRNIKRKIDDTPFLHRKPRIIGECFFACYNNKESNPLYEFRNKFNSNEEHTCLIQVIQDNQKPELNGKIMIYQFRKTVYSKLYDALHPSNEFQKSHNPFLLEAYGFAINLYQKTLGDGVTKFPNFDNCKFIDKKFGIVDENHNNITDQNKIQEFLTDETIISEFEKNEFKEWDENTKRFVAEAIVSTLPDCTALRKIKDKYPEYFVLLEDENNEANVTKVQQEEKVVKKETIKEDINIEDDDSFLDEFNINDELKDIDF